MLSIIAADLTKVFGKGNRIEEMDVDYNIELSYDTNTLSQILNAVVYSPSKDLINPGAYDFDKFSKYESFTSSKSILFAETKTGYIPLYGGDARNAAGVKETVGIMEGLPYTDRDSYGVMHFSHDPYEPLVSGEGYVKTFHRVDWTEVIAPEEIVESTRLIETNVDEIVSSGNYEYTYIMKTDGSHEWVFNTTHHEVNTRCTGIIFKPRITE